MAEVRARRVNPRALAAITAPGLISAFWPTEDHDTPTWRHRYRSNLWFVIHMAGDVTPMGQSMSAEHPKLDGDRVTLRSRVYPDYHSWVTGVTRARGISISDYVMELIDRDREQQRIASAQGVLDLAG